MATLKKTKNSPRKTNYKAAKTKPQDLTGKYVVLPTTSRNFAIFSVTVLFASTIVWALLGAKIQQSNADQLVNSFMFEHWSVLHAGVFPGSHTFLIKWPLFLIVKLLGGSAAAFMMMTVAVCLATVASLAYILHKIEPRPHVFGVIILALASILLLVPPQPYPGGILPVNMAMIATRNIEYILYIASLLCIIHAKRLRSFRFLLGVGGLGLLIASDKLFFTLSFGGAALALASYLLFRRRYFMSWALRWLLASLLALVVSAAILWAINSNGITSIAGQAQNGPYGLVHSFKDFVLGCVFALLGLLTNFGANPAFNAQVLKAIPELARSRLLSPSGITFLGNGLIAVLGVFSALYMWLLSIAKRLKKDAQPDAPIQLSLMLIWSSLAAVGAFVATNHYYVVDARYLSISLFAVFITIATWTRQRKYAFGKPFVVLSFALVFSILLGLFSVGSSYNADINALADVNQRNLLITESLKHHRVDVLVGDYWRVMPIKGESPDRKAAVMPLDGCLQPRTSLTSKSWELDLQKHSFAYILSFDKSLTNYPNCTLEQVTKSYGRPNASTLIAGKLDNPKELLLFYDSGIHKSAPAAPEPQRASGTTLPISIGELPPLDCTTSPRLMNIVAHEDDDLLFTSPDLVRALAAKDCVRSVYLTAGDAGSGQLYWLGREKGSEAAYSTMLGINNIWVERVVKLADNQFAVVANPRGNQHVSLVFLRLPDGNITGQGFKAFKYESLANLEANKVPLMHSVDGQSQYSSSELEMALATLIETYKPTEIHTQTTRNFSMKYSDHSDHMAAGRYADRALQHYTGIPAPVVKYYLGYPIHAMSQNVFDADLDVKVNAFLAYANFDGGTCRTLPDCDLNTVYGVYLRRQYTQ